MSHLILHSVPRSGSTWLGSIFDSHPKVNYKYQPLFSYAFKGSLNENSTIEDIEAFFNEIAWSNDDFINQSKEKKEGIIPDFAKAYPATHVCYKEVRYHHILKNLITQDKNVKAVLLIRNPLAVLHSWYLAPKEFKKELGWNFDEEWLNAPKKNLDKPEEFNGFNKWKEAAFLFLELKDKFPNQVRIVEYKNLLTNPVEITKSLFEFVGLDYVKQTEDFLERISTTNQRDAYSVYKIKKEDKAWKNLPKHIIDYIEKDLKNTKLEQFLYD